MLINSEAIVLRKIDYGETSLICTLFTKEAGKVTIIAKGAKKPKNPIGHILEPINILDVNFYNKPSRNIQILKEASISKNFQNIRNNYEKILYSLIFIEYIDRVTRFENQEPIIFRLIKSVLVNLDSNHVPNQLIYIFFCYQLTTQLGFMIEYRFCDQCHRPLKASIFNIRKGGLCCKKCLPNGKFYFSSKLVSSLEQISKIHIQHLHKLVFNNQILSELKFFLDLYIKFHIHDVYNLKSLKFIK